MNAAVFYHILDKLLILNKQGATWQYEFRLSAFKIRLIFFRECLYTHFTQAFKHLETMDESEPQLTIYVCDHFSSVVPLKLPTSMDFGLQTRGEMLALSDKNILTSYNHHDGALNIVHLNRNVAVYWIRGLRYLPWWTAGSPLQRILACWMRHQQHELTHAAAVGDLFSSVLFAGKSGAGKSTTTLACTMAGMQSLSEDYCLIQQASVPVVHNVYNTLKLDEKTLQFFPQLAPWIANKNRKNHEKALVFQSPEFPGTLASSLPIKAVFVLEKTSSQQTRYVVCSKSEALLALSASTILQLSWSFQSTMAFYGQFLEQVPCYKLLLGTDLNNVAQCVATFLKRQRP